MQHPDNGRGGELAEVSASQIQVATNNATAHETAAQFAEVLSGILGTEHVPPDSHFFEDLGADSMVMARFCARVRKNPDLPSVSMKDVYKHPTIRALATTVADSSSVATPTRAAAEPQTLTEVTSVRTAQYVLCGVLQLLSMAGYFYVLALGLVRILDLTDSVPGLNGLYARSLMAGSVEFLTACTLPILIKWILIGRWKPEEIRVWSLAYVRFWFVKTVVQLNPVILFAGSPLYVLYLRALGAKIGRDAVIFSLHVPVCTDLITIGERAIVCKDSFLNGYRAESGVIQTGPVSLGKDAFVGEMSVLDIETSLGDGAQLGHSSSLHAGQSIPAGEFRNGSPARQRTDVSYRASEPVRCSRVRKVTYSLAELGVMLVLASSTLAGGGWLIERLAERPGFAALASGTLPGWTYVGETLVVSCVLFFGALLLGLGFVVTVPRLLGLFIEPDRVYRLYGFHYWAHRIIDRVTNVKFFPRLFGDSSYIVYYLSWLGYELRPIVQTGSNFGLHIKHITPHLVTVGSGTMVADGLSIINAEYSSASFRVSRVTIGRDNFVGNQIAYPLQGKTGENCLLANKVMVPVDGEVREGVGLLGSPCFEIPRTVLRDSKYEVSGEEQHRRLAQKNRHNLVTMGLFLLVYWIYTAGLLTIAGATTALHGMVGHEPLLALGFVPAILFRGFYFVLVERAGALFRDLQPQHCSIYDPYFWFHERYWKLMARTNEVRILDGTPLKGLIWRLLGVRMGRRLFDDGCGITEATMVEIGDDCTLNAGSFIQPHSQEDGGFKSDRIRIGNGCTLGVAAWVHYGVTVGDGAQLAPDSFVMKGEEVPANAHWGENPARELREGVRADAAITAAAQFWPAAQCGATTLQGGQSA